MPNVTVVLLAAGESTRMGEPKALLPWGDSTLLEYQVDELRAAGVTDIVVVLGANSGQLHSLLASKPSVYQVLNTDYALGKTTSIKAGVQAATPDTEHFLIIGVDQPRPRTVFSAVIAHHIATGARITVPTYLGKRGHPILFRVDLREELFAIREETLGLREIVFRRAREVSLVETDSPTIPLDLNQPEQYEEARRIFWPRGART